MNIKRYSNEIIVLVSLLLMLGAYIYKANQENQQREVVTGVKHSLAELKEVVALEKIWGDKKLIKKVALLQKTIAPSKLKWSQKQNKVTASYDHLSANELNKLITKILNTPVIISLLEINKVGETYTVEFKCEW